MGNHQALRDITERIGVELDELDLGTVRNILILQGEALQDAWADYRHLSVSRPTATRTVQIPTP